MVLLDALLISGSLQGVHRLVLATCHFAFPRSAGTQGIARGYRAGFLLVTQRARNSLMHALVGNKDEEHNANNIEDFFEHRIKLSRNALLGMRTSGYTADFTPPRLQPTPRAKRTGDRVEIPTATGQKIYRSRRRTKPRRSGRIRRISLGAANSPAPPQRGTPGVTSLTNQECKPQLPPKGRGSRARCQRRRLYRQWRRLSRGIIPPQASGRPLVSQGNPLKAAQRCDKNTRAKLFRRLVLEQSHPRKKDPHHKVKLATPPIAYGETLSVGTQN